MLDNDITTRISILKRFRELLVEQRGRFRSYLDILDKQKDVIAHGNINALSDHVDLEEKIVADILSIQKTIEPMRPLYEASWTASQGKNLIEISELSKTLDSLKSEAARRVHENKELLKERMSVLRSEIKNIQANPFLRTRKGSAESAAPSFLDLKG